MCQIVYENKNRQIEDLTVNDLPYNLNDDYIEVNDMDYGKIEVEERAQELNHKYYNYYKATEKLLDEKLGEDDPILETDCGSEYLSARKAITNVLGEEENCDEY